MTTRSGAMYDVTIELGEGHDHSAFYLLGRVQGALDRAGASEDAVREFLREAQSGDYEHLLRTARRYVNVV